MSGDAGEMETLADEAAFQLETAEKAEGSYLPEALVQAQVELAALGPSEISRQLADMVIAAALIGFASTPRKAMEKLLAGYLISDESWDTRVGPELRKVLSARGVKLPALEDAPPAVPPLPEERVEGLPPEPTS